jgi:hypothetical protein
MTLLCNAVVFAPFPLALQFGNTMMSSGCVLDRFAVESVCKVAVPELLVETSSGLRNMTAKNCDDVSSFV